MPDLSRPMVTLNIDGTPREMRAHLWRLVVAPGTPSPGVHIHLSIDPGKPLRWETLDQLPDLKEITYYGPDPGIERYVARRASIKTLALYNHGRAALQIADSQVDHLLFHIPKGGLRVSLPASTTRLNLVGDFSGHGGLRVDAPGRGAGMDVSAGSDDVIPGLEDLSSLDIGRAAVSVTKLGGYGKLKDLGFFSCKAISGMADLPLMEHLERLRFLECYSVNSAAIPPLEKTPRLKKVSIHGVRQHDAARFKAKWGSLPDFEMRGIRSNAWLEKNTDNPFRDWEDEYGPLVGRRAAGFYRKAFTAMGKEGVSSSRVRVREVLKDFVDALNKLAKKYPFDTIARENVSDAFDLLAKKTTARIDGDELHGWLGSWERF